MNSIDAPQPSLVRSYIVGSRRLSNLFTIIVSLGGLGFFDWIIKLL